MHHILGKADLVAHDTQLLRNYVLRNSHSEAAVEPLKLNVYLCSLEGLYVFINERSYLHLGIKLTEELHAERKCLIATLGVDCLLVSRGGLGTVIVAECGSAHAL